jgi:hypothetical protein
MRELRGEDDGPADLRGARPRALKSLNLPTSLETPRADRASGDGEARAAVMSAAGLYLVGALLTACAVLLPRVSSPAGVAVVGATATLTAILLVVAAKRWRGGLLLAWIADLWGVLLIAVLCAASGGARSPFALIYFFAIGHAAAFQPRTRLAVVSLASVVGFFSPLTYSHVSTTFGAVACVGMVLALLSGGVVHYALNRVREHRRLLELLINASFQLDGSLDPADTLRRIAGTAVPGLADLCVIDLIEREGALASTVAAAPDPAVAAQIERLRSQAPLDPRGADAVARAVERNEPCSIDDLAAAAAAARLDHSEDYRRFVQAAGYRSAVVFPMFARGRTHGAISFLHAARRGRYRPNQLAVLEDFSGRAAMALDNARLYADRARVAGTLRRSLMPATLPVIPGVELASFFRPMGAGDEVGGDFFDVFRDGHGFWLVVGDVCGKGAEAAALTGFLRHTAMAYARETTSPARVLSEVNQAMLEQDFGGRFATALLVHLEPRQAGFQARIAGGGHPPALLVRASGEVEEVGDCGTLLGVFDDPTIRDCSVMLMPGEVLALYTDGLSDAHAPGRTVTAAEMIQALARSSPSNSQGAIDTLIELVEPDGARDDIAILSVQVTALAGTEREGERTPGAVYSTGTSDRPAPGPAAAAAAD